MYSSNWLAVLVLCHVAAVAHAHPDTCNLSQPVPTVRQVETTTYYSDSHSSIIDPAKKQQNERDVSEIDVTAVEVAKLANEYSLGNRCSGEQALRILDAWASAKSMTPAIGFQGNVTAMLYGMSFVSSFAQISPLCLKREECDRIKAWLINLSHNGLIFFNTGARKRNNLSYWSSAFAVYTGRFADDPKLIDRGKSGLMRGFSDIGPNGFSLENSRGRRALFYNAYAFTALTWGAAAVSREWLLARAAENPNVSLLERRLEDYSHGNYDQSLYPTPQELVHFPYWRLPWTVATATSAKDVCEDMDPNLKHKVLGGRTDLMLSRIWDLDVTDCRQAPRQP
ncbi:alginate lyase family protein [Stenotrophomonas maltophilia]|uniref:alginate lyase family protein n=1 Tax=Stenotrophomonas maltophilia TaxID=40324 RepID=UPI0012F87E0B|nr:alginate lyase family protein [Stenotrophomonas maltophilia]